MSADPDTTLSAKIEVFQRGTHRSRACPRCHVGTVRRARSRTWWESLRKTITSLRPHRCDRCEWRGWRAVDPGREAGLRTDSPPGPRDPRGAVPGDRWRQLDLELLDEASQDKPRS